MCGAVLLFVTAPSFAQIGKTLHGKVETKNGEAIGAAVQVTLQAQQGGPLMNSPVDSDGNFEFSGLGTDMYALTVKAESFQTYQQTVDLSDSFKTDYNIEIYLLPINQPKINPAGEPPLTDLAAPKNARKEFEEAKRDWQKKKLKDEQKHLEKAVTEYPCYARAQAALAELERAQKKLSNAEASYKQAIKCDGTFLHAFYGLADLYLAENKPAESETVLLQAQRTVPNDWKVRYELGATHLVMGEYPKAAQDFVAVESLHPDMPASFHVQLANTYLKTGEYGKALAQIDTYLRLSPKGRYSDNARKLAATLRKHGVTEATKPAAAPSTDKP